MYSIYILLTRTNTILSRAIHRAPGNEYTHAALSLDPTFTRLYSFGRKYRYSYLPAGFVLESVDRGVLGADASTKCAVYELIISEETYVELCRVLEKMESEKGLYQYNILGLLLCLFGIEKERRYHFFCSQFISYVLEISGAAEPGKAPSLMRPVDFRQIPGVHQIFCGNIAQLRNTSFV